MKSVVALLLVGLVCVAAVSQTERTQFKAWKAKHGKTYASATEEAHALSNFAATLARIRAHSLKGHSSFGLNSLSDLSPAEFKAKYLSGYVPTEHTAPVMKQSSKAAPPASFDWRSYDANVVTPVKDQGQCGSCWAFSATESLESQWYLTHKTQVILSPQQTVDCDDVDAGCDGGDLPTAFTYMKGAGVETEKAYPYTSGPSGETGTCHYKKASVVATVTGYEYAIPPCNDTCDDQMQYVSALKTAIAAASSGIHGPPAICVNAEPWQDYVGPEPLDGDCDYDYSDLDHCVQLVGYNGTASTPYWIVRNSWNTDWGVAGYIHLNAKINNQCGVLDEVAFPLASTSSAAAHRRVHH